MRFCRSGLISQFVYCHFIYPFSFLFCFMPVSYCYQYRKSICKNAQGLCYQYVQHCIVTSVCYYVIVFTGDVMNKTSSAVKTRYNNRNYDVIMLRTKSKELSKDGIKAAADRSGASLNGYIVQAIKERMERESK